MFIEAIVNVLAKKTKTWWSSSRSSRDKAILISVFTALGAKGCGVILQIAAIPYAVRTLGVEVYGAYAAAVALFAWFSMLEVGLGSSLIRNLVSALAREDSAAASSLFYTGIVVASLLVVGIWGILLSIGGILVMTGHAGEFSNSFHLLIYAGCLAGLQIVTGAAGRTRAAFQETHINNCFGAAANLLSALLLWILVKPGATALVILLALNGPLIGAQLCNGVVLIAGKPILRSRWELHWAAGLRIFREGIWLIIAQGGVFLERQAPILILTVSSTLIMVGQYACGIQLLLIFAGLVTMVSAPLMPAIVDALHHGDIGWWQRRVLLLEIGIFLAGSAGAGIMAKIGPGILGELFGHKVAFDQNECASLAIWTTTVLASHVLYTVLVAAGRTRFVAAWQVSQGASVFIAFLTLHERISLGAMFWVYAAITVIMTLLPWSLEAGKLAREAE